VATLRSKKRSCTLKKPYLDTPGTDSCSAEKIGRVHLAEGEWDYTTDRLGVMAQNAKWF